MTKYVFEIKLLDYDTFMSTDTKQNDIMDEMFTLSKKLLNNLSYELHLDINYCTLHSINTSGC